MEKKSNLHLKIMVIVGIICAIIWSFPYLYLISSAFKPGTEVVSIPAKFFSKRIINRKFYWFV